MFRVLLLMGGAGVVLARYLTGPEGLRRRDLLKQRLANLPRDAVRAGTPLASPVGNLFAQLGTAALVARAGRRGGVQGTVLAMVVGRLLRSLKS
jgi:hypothetical protein